MNRSSEPENADPADEPMGIDTTTLVAAGEGGWLIALILTIAVPSWHRGEHSWWPWTCVVGLALGLALLGYVHLGKGSAVFARIGTKRAEKGRRQRAGR